MKTPQLKTLVLCIVLLSTASLGAQNFELGIFGGGTQYKGDLSEKNINLQTTQPVGGISLKYNLSPYFGLRTGIGAAYIEGSDEYATDPDRRNRNLSFRTEIVELSLTAVVNFADINKTTYMPYVFGGVAGFYFNPRAQYNGEWIALRPLTTEGQGTSAKPGTQPYDQFAFSLPFGGGLKTKISDRVIIGVEAGLRKTFTNYLDDVANTYANPQVLMNERGPLSAELADRSDELMPEPPTHSGGEKRGDAEVNDWYGFGVVSVSFLLGKENKGNRNNTNYGCPVKF